MRAGRIHRSSTSCTAAAARARPPSSLSMRPTSPSSRPNRADSRPASMVNPATSCCGTGTTHGAPSGWKRTPTTATRPVGRSRSGEVNWPAKMIDGCTTGAAPAVIRSKQSPKWRISSGLPSGSTGSGAPRAGRGIPFEQPHALHDAGEPRKRRDLRSSASITCADAIADFINSQLPTSNSQSESVEPGCEGPRKGNSQRLPPRRCGRSALGVGSWRLGVDVILKPERQMNTSFKPCSAAAR